MVLLASPYLFQEEVSPISVISKKLITDSEIVMQIQKALSHQKDWLLILLKDELYYSVINLTYYAYLLGHPIPRTKSIAMQIRPDNWRRHGTGTSKPTPVKITESMVVNLAWYPHDFYVTQMMKEKESANFSQNGKGSITCYKMLMLVIIESISVQNTYRKRVEAEKHFHIYITSIPQSGRCLQLSFLIYSVMGFVKNRNLK